jgi:WD40 repeat protein
MMANIPAIDVASGPSQNNSLLSFQCRGCVFSADGKQLYTILCGRKGATHLVKFSLKFDDQNRIIDAVPNKTVIANKDPSTCLVMSDNGEFLAVGCSNGFVTVLRTDALSKVISRACHDDYPVTGVVFASSVVTKAENSNCYFLTCSVDNRMATVILRKRLTLLLIFAFMLLLLGYLCWLLYNKR